MLACSLSAGDLIFLFLTRNPPGTPKSPALRHPEKLHDDGNDDDGQNVPRKTFRATSSGPLASCVLACSVLGAPPVGAVWGSPDGSW